MKNFKRILLTLVAALLVFAMCFAMVGCGNDKDKDEDNDKDDKSGSSSKVEVKKDKPEDIADKFMSAMFEECDAEKMTDLIHPDIVDAMVEDQYDGDKDAFIEEGQQAFDQINEAFEENDILVYWEIADAKDLKGDELKDIQEKYEDDYNLEVTAAAMVDVDLIAEYEGEENSTTMEIPVVEIDGQWYIDNEGVGSAMGDMGI